MAVPLSPGPPLSTLDLGEFTTPARIGLIVALAVVFNFIGRRFVGRALRTLRAGASKASLARPDGAARAEQRLTALSSVLTSVVTFIVIVIATFMTLGELGIELGPLLAGAGIVGVAVGFGAQSLVKDFLAGIFILIEDQFGVGDLVTVNDQQVTGTIEGVSLRATRLRALDGTLWHIPNGEILAVGNQSLQWSRALVDIEVAYDTNLATARALITRVGRELAADDPAVLENPEVWGVEQLGASGISLRVVTRTAPTENPRISRELRERVKLAFDEEGIEIPFPQATLWHREPAPST